MILYDYLSSGNAYKVRLLLNQLGLDYERVSLDIDKGETRTPAFLEKNQNGRIPLLELEDGTCLAESNAIMSYLAEGTPFLSDDRVLRARTLQWMFFEQYNHEPSIAVSRYILQHTADSSPRRGELAALRDRGNAALDVMERHLSNREYFVNGGYSIADISLYAYTHVAEEGGFKLKDYSAIGAWLRRCQAEPNHISITYEH